jgi:2-polyprenyl-6-methoxyphenol hydroxylase-like FAD-dependent oxidoreductase
MKIRTDVVVVGARASGAATALLLARLGHDVVVLERANFPSDTISTHQIARTGVVQLHRWGLLQSVLASGAPAIRAVTFSAEGDTVTRSIKDRSGVDHLVAPRRYVLDTLVAEAATEAGATIRFGATVTGLHRHPAGRITGVYGHDHTGTQFDIDARFVVGADGLRSVVARAVDAPVIENRGDGSAAQYTYYDGIPWPAIELHVAEHGLAGVFPTHDGQACIWISSPTSAVHAARRQAASRDDAFLSQLEQTAPQLAGRLRAARRTAPVTGMLRLPNIVRQAYGPGWALVGDAGYHRDAITGHGLSDAYRDAELLAAALDQALRDELPESAALAAYQGERDRSLRDIFDITCALSAYPAVPAFVELQKQLSVAIDVEAATVAARPLRECVRA